MTTQLKFVKASKEDFVVGKAPQDRPRWNVPSPVTLHMHDKEQGTALAYTVASMLTKLYLFWFPVCPGSTHAWWRHAMLGTPQPG